MTSFPVLDCPNLEYDTSVTVSRLDCHHTLVPPSVGHGGTDIPPTFRLGASRTIAL